MDLFELSKILSRDDIIHLTIKLNEKISKKRISDETKLTRRTLDKYFNEEVTDIKYNNKLRLLGASFTYNREYTFNFILRRLKTLIASQAFSNLDFIFEKLTNTKSDKKFREYYAKFISILYENKYYLLEKYRDEILGFSDYLEEKQKSLLTIFIPPTNIILNAEREVANFNNSLAQIWYFPYLSYDETISGDQEVQDLSSIEVQDIWTRIEYGGDQYQVSSSI